MSGPSGAATVTSAGEETLKLGLLMETAQLHQQLIGQSLAQLQAHTEGLDAVVRDEIRRTFVLECGAVLEEARMAADALQRLKQAANRRFALWAAVLTVLSGGTGMLVLERIIPSGGELTSLRAQREQLLTEIRQLSDRGGRIELRRCGSAQRLCVRVDKQGPAFGESADYFVVKGY